MMSPCHHLTLLLSLSAVALASVVHHSRHQPDWILQRIQSINAAEVAAIDSKHSVGSGGDSVDIESAVRTVLASSDYGHLSEQDLRLARDMLLQMEDLLASSSSRGGDRSGRGLFDLFVSLADMSHDSDTLIRGGNSTNHNDRGILDFVSEVAGTILGGVSNKNDGPVLIPNHCW